MQTKTSLTILLTLAVLLALTIQPKQTFASHSPIPRPTLDPNWICQQLNNCPTRAPHKPHRRHSEPGYITIQDPASPIEPAPFYRLP